MIDLLSQMRFATKPQLFQALSEESLGVLLGNSFLQDAPANKLLLQQGDTASHLYLIAEGSLRTFRVDKEGREATIRMLQAGNTCMEAVMFMDGPSPINVQAVTPSRILFIPEKAVKAQVLADSQFATNLLRIVAHHYKNAMHQIDAINIKSPVQRIGYYFLTRHIEAGHDHLDFELPFQKQQISNYLGITPETFSRALKQMKDLGINVDNQTIKLRDAFSLCHFCDPDTAAMCPKQGSAGCTACKNS